MKKITLLAIVLVASAFSTASAQETKMQKDHPNYYETMNLLRKAWWWMEPKPAAGDEQSAERSTSLGWEAIHTAGIEYSKTFNDKPTGKDYEDTKGHKERWKKAYECLESAKAALDKADAKFDTGLKEKVLKDINEAEELVKKVIAAAK
jgi:hypothetical protein